jgi:cathepsin X
VAATGILGDRFCVHKAEFDAPINLPGDGAGGSGGINRAFQYAGNCARSSDSVRNHGCKRKSVFPSPQALVSCGSLTENSSLYPSDAGCNGGNAYEAWCAHALSHAARNALACVQHHAAALADANRSLHSIPATRRRFYRLTGAPPMDSTQSTGCVPYTSGGCVTPGGDPNNDGCRRCEGLLDQCQDSGLVPPSYKVSSYGMLNTPPLPERDDPSVDRPASPEMAAREANIQREILANGPVLGCIFDYHNFVDFFNTYPLGVYNSTEGSEAYGGHCMNIMGWGVDASSGLKYWLMRNTWGPAWGSAGIVRFKRGVDFLGIESDVWAACPAGAAHCELTAGVDTSVMEMPPDGPDLLRAPRGRGGGYWREQAPQSAMAARAAAEYVLAAGGDDATADAMDAGEVTPEEVLRAHGACAIIHERVMDAGDACVRRCVHVLERHASVRTDIVMHSLRLFAGPQASPCAPRARRSWPASRCASSWTCRRAAWPRWRPLRTARRRRRWRSTRCSCCPPRARRARRCAWTAW